jgi:hypothetical protein
VPDLKVNAHTRELAVSKPDQKTNDVVTEALNDVSKYVTAPNKENLMQIARRARKKEEQRRLPQRTNVQDFSVERSSRES